MDYMTALNGFVARLVLIHKWMKLVKTPAVSETKREWYEDTGWEEYPVFKDCPENREHERVLVETGATLGFKPRYIKGVVARWQHEWSQPDGIMDVVYNDYSLLHKCNLEVMLLQALGRQDILDNYYGKDGYLAKCAKVKAIN